MKISDERRVKSTLRHVRPAKIQASKSEQSYIQLLKHEESK